MRTYLYPVAALLAVVAGSTTMVNSAFSAGIESGTVHLRKATGHFYVWIGEPLTWDDANAFAGKYSVKHDGVVLPKWHLATITDSGENDFVFSVILGEKSDVSFLGAIVRDGGLRNFQWGTGEAFRYTNYAPGQPDFERENVLEMGGEYGAQWNNEDGPASPNPAAHPFILEHEPVQITSL